MMSVMCTDETRGVSGRGGEGERVLFRLPRSTSIVRPNFFFWQIAMPERGVRRAFFFLPPRILFFFLPKQKKRGERERAINFFLGSSYVPIKREGRSNPLSFFSFLGNQSQFTPVKKKRVRFFWFLERFFFNCRN